MGSCKQQCHRTDKQLGIDKKVNILKKNPTFISISLLNTYLFYLVVSA